MTRRVEVGAQRPRRRIFGFGHPFYKENALASRPARRRRGPDTTRRHKAVVKSAVPGPSTTYRLGPRHAPGIFPLGHAPWSRPTYPLTRMKNSAWGHDGGEMVRVRANDHISGTISSNELVDGWRWFRDDVVFTPLGRSWKTADACGPQIGPRLRIWAVPTRIRWERVGADWAAAPCPITRKTGEDGRLFPLTANQRPASRC